MKKNFLTKVALAAFVLSTASCKKDLLNQPPLGVQTDVSYFKTAADLNNTLTAAYNYLQQPTFPAYETARWVFGDVGSDDALKGAGASSFPIPGISEFSTNQQTTTNTIINVYWSSMYNMIAVCNLVLDKQSVVTGDATTITNIANEARFLRAYGYNELVKYFGDVPMPLTYLDPATVAMVKTPKAQVYAQIEKDLTEASALPTKTQWGAANDGRATSGAANALLGKVYMSQKKYIEAEAALKKVVDEGTYSLLSDYGAIFRKTGDNNNPESVFDIKHKSNTGVFPGEGSFNLAFFQPGDAPIGGFGQDEPTEDLQNEFEKGDPRAIYTILFKGDVFPNGATPYTVVNIGTAGGRLNRKFYIPPSEKVANFGSIDEAKSYHIIRYAEVILLYAEALNENGKPAEALAWLNKVRQRARTTPPSDPQRISTVYDLSYTGTLLPDLTTMDKLNLGNAIWHEQRVELSMEGHRRDYLTRTGRLAVRMAAAKGIAAFDEKYTLLPIPQSEIDLSNGQIIQNSGY
ncbi:MAG: RagB/SusD protein [Ferruginibacter sp.]|uniref:RagB/SusD family nutrient uptake outer membrane protein n=1 Tax=Ferruginibacter sp. TaxID=1940288 RepID=UPI00265AE7F6|nr:RagB/SusD family nutrient uptake outer membrane protein [Ferruginibacter sp.]MDB5279617.1 RagB/SusD protein [Ferruginibacter sp.]